jgi:hypothetical protein
VVRQVDKEEAGAMGGVCVMCLCLLPAHFGV